MKTTLTFEQVCQFVEDNHADLKEDIEILLNLFHHVILNPSSSSGQAKRRIPFNLLH